jgi:hypothetical protein
MLLFSVLSYVVDQQTKEIGVRMALGATTANVVSLVLSQSLRPVSSGLTAGGGLAVAVAIVLTATATELRSWMHMLDPVAYVASLLIIVTSCAGGIGSRPSGLSYRSDRDAQKGLRGCTIPSDFLRHRLAAFGLRRCDDLRLQHLRHLFVVRVLHVIGAAPTSR